MGKNSRSIGARFEREAARLCREHFYSPGAYRTAQRTGLGGTADISDALPNGHVECKKRDSMAVYNFFDQADEDKSQDQFSLVLLRANHRPTLVCFRIDDTSRFVEDILSNHAEVSGCSRALEAWRASQSGDRSGSVLGEQFDEHDQPVAKTRPPDRC